MKKKRYTNDVNGDLECANDRIDQLEALIRDVAIPELMACQIGIIESARPTIGKLREGINAALRGAEGVPLESTVMRGGSND